MNRFEQLIDDYAKLDFISSKEMPDALDGLCVGETVYINANTNQTTAEKYVIASEEVAHYDIGVTDITEQKTISEQKEEAKARRIGNRRLVSLDDLIFYFFKNQMTIEEITERLEITVECLENAIQDYRISYGRFFSHKEYCFHFYTDTHFEIFQK